MRVRAGLVALMMLSLTSGATRAEASAPQASLTAPDGLSYDRFGQSVALSGETAVMGAPGDDIDALVGMNEGSARVFVRSGASWSQQAVLTASDGSDADGLGFSVAVSGDTVLAGAPGNDDYAGAAYVFVRSGGTWTQVQRLDAPVPAAGQSFGHAVALDGDTAVIGALGTDGFAGAAYVFVRSAGIWSLQQRLFQDPGPYPPSSMFGRAVAVSGDTALIGASGLQGAFPFTRSGGAWTQGRGFTAQPDNADPGASVAVQAGIALVGDNPALGGAGSATVWRQHPDPQYPEIWGPSAQLRLREPTSERYGVSVALVGDTALVGAVGTSDPGSVYVFAYDAAVFDWAMVERLTSPAADGTEFGSAVALSGDTALAGSWAEEQSAGVAYVVSDAHPVPLEEAFSTDEDTPLTVGAPGLLGNDTDPDDTALTASLVQQPPHGTASVAADGSFSYTPHANYFGEDVFVYQACDHWMGCTSANVTLFVAPIDDRPGARDDAYAMFEDATLEVQAPGVLTNDSDVDPGVLRASPVLARQPEHGTVEMREDGSFRYSPTPDYFGPDGFAYNVVDPTGRSDTAEVALTVDPVNDAPVAADDAAATEQYASVEIPVLDNDADQDGDALFVSWVSQPAHGTVAISEDGTLVYRPDGTFKDGDAFTYVASDGSSGADPARVTITAISCGEDGIAALDGTPAEGTLSRTIDREIEPRLYRYDPELARELHNVNCEIVVPVERATE